MSALSQDDKAYLLSGLVRGAQQMDIALGETDVEKLIAYVDYLLLWNKTHNLTAVENRQKILTHHLLDSLSVNPHIQGATAMDVGSGAGLPGLVLALVRPDSHWTLVESRGKKAGFLREVKARLGMKNLSVFEGRVEDYRGDVIFDTLTARAVTSLSSLLRMTAHLCHPRLRLIAMKGVYPDDELAALSREQRELAQVMSVSVPGLSASRHIVVIEGLSG